MTENIKVKYLECVYRLIEEEGMEAVSIRRVAKEMGSNSATLYRHFDSVEHLICMAAVRYLEPYLNDIKESGALAKNPLQQNFKLWEKFCTYSFEKPEIFEMLFFGQYKDNLMDIMYEYYDIYKGGFIDLDAFSITFLFTSDIFERNYMFYRRAANQGLFSMEYAQMYSDLQVYAYHGMLLECITNHYTGADTERMIRKFIDYDNKLLSMILNKTE